MFRTRIARIVAALLLVAIVIGLMMYTSLGSAVGAPRESNRVRHPSGFSAIAPHGWLPVRTIGTPDGSKQDSLYFSPPKSEGRPISIIFARREEVDDAKLKSEGFAIEQINGRPTYHLQTTKRDRVDVYIFQADDTWFAATVIRHLGDYNDARWLEYIKSFRVEKPTTPLATQPLG
jgi:hypothetical protein